MCVMILVTCAGAPFCLSIHSHVHFGSAEKSPATSRTLPDKLGTGRFPNSLVVSFGVLQNPCSAKISLASHRETVVKR